METSERIAHVGSPHRLVLGAAFLLVAGIFLYPFQTTIVPQWSLRVVDDTGIAVRDIKVTEHWQHYLLESEGHDDIKTTVEDGHVSFPERTIRASLLRRALAMIVELTRRGSRARFSTYASVVVWGSKDHETMVAVYQKPAPPQQEISVHRLP